MDKVFLGSYTYLEWINNDMNDFLKTVEKEQNAVQESFSSSSYMDVTELRALYYGRLDIMVSFSNDEHYILSGYHSGDLIRPWGVVGHTVEDVVGRRVSSSDFYGHVFRDKTKPANHLKDINSYPKAQLQEDLELLSLFKYVDSERLENARERVLRNPRAVSPFVQLWSIMRLTFENSHDGDKRWAKAFVDLGYEAITDQRGIGLFTDKKAGTLYFDIRSLERFDIVPVQKYRSDPRNRVRDNVDRIVKRLRVRRNRVAKKPLKDSRGSSDTLQKNTLQKLLS